MESENPDGNLNPTSDPAAGLKHQPAVTALTTAAQYKSFHICLSLDMPRSFQSRASLTEKFSFFRSILRSVPYFVLLCESTLALAHSHVSRELTCLSVASPTSGFANTSTSTAAVAVSNATEDCPYACTVGGDSLAYGWYSSIISQVVAHETVIIEISEGHRSTRTSLNSASTQAPNIDRWPANLASVINRTTFVAGTYTL